MTLTLEIETRFIATAHHLFKWFSVGEVCLNQGGKYYIQFKTFLHIGLL